MSSPLHVPKNRIMIEKILLYLTSGENTEMGLIGIYNHQLISFHKKVHDYVVTYKIKKQVCFN